MARLSLVVCLLLLLWPLSALSKPRGGKIRGITFNMTETVIGYECRSLGLYSGARFIADMRIKASKENTTVLVTISIFRSPCANFELNNLSCQFSVVPESVPESDKPFWVFSATQPVTYTLTSSSQTIDFDVPPTEAQSPSPTEKPSKKPFYALRNDSGMFIVQIIVEKTTVASVNMSVNLEMINFYGYLSALDYPALVFYGIMTAIYGLFGILWFILMCCSYKDLVRLQFWIAAVIILGFLEKTFFVSEYSSINDGVETTLTSGVFLVAEAVSAVKRALARMLLVIVSLGFGTVKPRLGDSLGKVLAAGGFYFVLALIDGIVRAKQETAYSISTPAIITFTLVFLADSAIFLWIFNSIVATRRTLRLRKNYVKLSLYNHFAYTLIFGMLASVTFTLWVFIELNFPSGNCLTDWREIWLRDCFWHILFCIVLGIIMILWRPSSNRVRFAYSRVNDYEEEEEMEQGPNKNFDTVKMRPVGKPPSTPPVSSQAEDDLRWVEENLPTSAVDKALPLILDSDEEVMTTRFEVSKMN